MLLYTALKCTHMKYINLIFVATFMRKKINPEFVKQIYEPVTCSWRKQRPTTKNKENQRVFFSYNLIKVEKNFHTCPAWVSQSHNWPSLSKNLKKWDENKLQNYRSKCMKYRAATRQWQNPRNFIYCRKFYYENLK